ncbi:hypothetical protein FUT87_11490, partial [Mitsuaria sp. TWR114]
MGAMTPAQLAAISNYGALSASAIAAITPEALKALSPMAISRLTRADCLSIEAIRELSAEQAR